MLWLSRWLKYWALQKNSTEIRLLMTNYGCNHQTEKVWSIGPRLQNGQTLPNSTRKNTTVQNLKCPQRWLDMIAGPICYRDNRKLLCWHQDSNPQPSDPPLLVRALPSCRGFASLWLITLPLSQNSVYDLAYKKAKIGKAPRQHCS